MLRHFWREIAAVVVVAAITVMTILDWWEPALWYIKGKGAAVSDAVLPAAQQLVASLLG